MAFNLTSDFVNGVARITLSGELDASVAGQFKTAVEQAAESKPKSLALLVGELTYMSSAGLRALVFAKQKMGAAIRIFVVGAQETVLETIEMTGFNHSVVLLDAYDAAQIEA
jgi:anti-anti-sigma factor